MSEATAANAHRTRNPAVNYIADALENATRIGSMVQQIDALRIQNERLTHDAEAVKRAVSHIAQVASRIETVNTELRLKVQKQDSVISEQVQHIATLQNELQGTRNNFGQNIDQMQQHTRDRWHAMASSLDNNFKLLLDRQKVELDYFKTSVVAPISSMLEHLPAEYLTPSLEAVLQAVQASKQTQQLSESIPAQTSTAAQTIVASAPSTSNEASTSAPPAASHTLQTAHAPVDARTEAAPPQSYDNSSVISSAVQGQTSVPTAEPSVSNPPPAESSTNGHSVQSTVAVVPATSMEASTALPSAEDSTEDVKPPTLKRRRSSSVEFVAASAPKSRVKYASGVIKIEPGLEDSLAEEAVPIPAPVVVDPPAQVQQSAATTASANPVHAPVARPAQSTTANRVYATQASSATRGVQSAARPAASTTPTSAARATTSRTSAAATMPIAPQKAQPTAMRNGTSVPTLNRPVNPLQNTPTAKGSAPVSATSTRGSTTVPARAPLPSSSRLLPDVSMTASSRTNAHALAQATSKSTGKIPSAAAKTTTSTPTAVGSTNDLRPRSRTADVPMATAAIGTNTLATRTAATAGDVDVPMPTATTATADVFMQTTEPAQPAERASHDTSTAMQVDTPSVRYDGQTPQQAQVRQTADMIVDIPIRSLPSLPQRAEEDFVPSPDRSASRTPTRRDGSVTPPANNAITDLPQNRMYMIPICIGRPDAPSTQCLVSDSPHVPDSFISRNFADFLVNQGLARRLSDRPSAPERISIDLHLNRDEQILAKSGRLRDFSRPYFTLIAQEFKVRQKHEMTDGVVIGQQAFRGTDLSVRPSQRRPGVNLFVQNGSQQATELIPFPHSELSKTYKTRDDKACALAAYAFNANRTPDVADDDLLNRIRPPQSNGGRREAESAAPDLLNRLESQSNNRRPSYDSRHYEDRYDRDHDDGYGRGGDSYRLPGRQSAFPARRYSPAPREPRQRYSGYSYEDDHQDDMHDQLANGSESDQTDDPEDFCVLSPDEEDQPSETDIAVPLAQRLKNAKEQRAEWRAQRLSRAKRPPVATPSTDMDNDSSGEEAPTRIHKRRP